MLNFLNTLFARWISDPNNLIPYLLAIPLCVAILLPFLRKKPNIREGVILIASSLLFLGVLYQYLAFMDSSTPITYTFVNVSTNLSISFKIEPIGMLFAVVATILWPIATVYSIGYMRANKENFQTRFYTCFAIAIFAVLGIAFASDMFTLFCFYEMLSISTFPLVTHKNSAKAMRAGRIYLGILIGTSIGFMLPAIFWTFYLTGTTEFLNGGILKDKISGLPLMLLLALYIFGIGKAALMPFHKWLPTAMIAPTPVSALLHAVAVVKAGVFTVLKVIVYIFGIDFLKSQIDYTIWFLYLTSFTLIASSIIALLQDNLKKRLAYSTISQLAYITMAASLFNPLAIMGGMIHIAAHAFGKITLFFAAGSIYTATHKTEISQLNGLGHKMPITFACFAIGAISMIGLPPAAGFISKWYLIQGAWSVHSIVAMSAIIISTLLNAAYLIPIVYKGFFVKATTDISNYKEAPWPIVLGLTLTASLTILMFIFPAWAINLARLLTGVA